MIQNFWNILARWAYTAMKNYSSSWRKHGKTAKHGPWYHFSYFSIPLSMKPSVFSLLLLSILWASEILHMGPEYSVWCDFNCTELSVFFILSQFYYWLNMTSFLSVLFPALKFPFIICTAAVQEDCCCVTRDGNAYHNKARGHGWCESEVIIFRATVTTRVRWMCLLTALCVSKGSFFCFISCILLLYFLESISLIPCFILFPKGHKTKYHY